MAESTIIRTGENKTLIDKAISESMRLVLNNGKYSLMKVLEYIKSVGELSKFPNLVKLNQKMPGTILLACGGMAVLKLPYIEGNTKPKKSKASSGKALF